MGNTNNSGRIKRFNDPRDWIFEKKLGLFIHWGLYTLREWHEQELWRTDISRREYEKLQHEFNPVAFDPDQWINIAKTAGMESICITAKHLDGFCLWDTKYTPYNVMNTPYGKDIIKLLSDACRRHRLGFGVYYSLPDHHHRNCPNLGRCYEMLGARTGDEPDEEKYLTFVENQVRELCTSYGPINQFFWDANVRKYHRPQINDLIRHLQPGAVINERGPGAGDFETSERRIPEEKEFTRPTIGLQSTGRESWCYRRDEDYYSHKFLLQSIDKILAMGGHYQLNVGPKSDGTICEEDCSTLKKIGDWYKRVREAFEDCTPCSYMIVPTGDGLIRYDDVLLTRSNNSVYVHCYRDLETSGVMLYPLHVLPDRAVLLNNRQELETLLDVTPVRYLGRSALRIAGLPVNLISDEPLIIRLDFNPEIFE